MILLFILTFALSTSPVSAQSATPSTVPSTIPQTLNPNPSSISPTSPLFTDLLVHNVFHSFSCLAVGSSIIGQPCLSYRVIQNAQGMVQTVPVLSQTNFSGGALGTTTSLIGLLYTNRPIRTTDYLASVGEGLGVKTAHAQVAGSGANVLSPILNLWQVSRNISYLIMIIIFVIIGLMVMFRQRINPQTVITAQAALPGLVIGLILITFSYFLAALISDSAFIGTNLVGYYFVAAQSGTQENLVDKTKGDNVITIVSSLLKGVKKDDIADATGTLFKAIGEPNILDTSNPATLIRGFAAGAAYQIGSTIGPAIGAALAAGGCAASAFAIGPAALLAVPVCAGIGQITGSIGGGLGLAQQTWANPGGMVGYALWVAAIVIIVYSMLKLLLRLINNFLSIIFLTISAPFQFLAAALPGRQGLATGWILNMLCNVLAFPAVMAVFYFVNYLLGPQPGSPFQINSSTNLTNHDTLPLFGGLNISFIRVLAAFGALVATPAIPDIICRTIGRVGVAGQLIGQELSGSSRAGQGYLGQSQGAMGGVSRDLGRVGELSTQPGGQYMPDGKGGWSWIETKVPGKIELARRRLKI